MRHTAIIPCEVIVSDILFRTLSVTFIKSPSKESTILYSSKLSETIISSTTFASKASSTRCLPSIKYLPYFFIFLFLNIFNSFITC